MTSLHARLRAALTRLLPARAGQAPGTPENGVEDVGLRRGVLLQQLQELELTASRRPKDVVTAERQMLEDAMAHLAEPPPESPGQASRPAFAFGVMVVALAAGVAVFGGGRLAARPPASPKVVPLVPRLAAQDPMPDSGPTTEAGAATDDLEASLQKVRLQLDRQEYMQVWTETQKILQRSPDNPRALTFQSEVRLAMGQPEVALEMLKRALDRDPDLLQAYINKSHVELGLGREKEAAASIEEAKRRFPAQAAWLDSGFANMKATTTPFAAGVAPGDNPHGHLGVAPAGSALPNPHEGLSPGARIHPGPDDDFAPPATGESLSATLDLDPPLQGHVPEGAVVFVTVREAGVRSGPPVAAKRLRASFPQAFTLGPQDSMQGQGLPRKVLLEARIDLDGDASTHEPTDPRALLDGVDTGGPPVRLVLKRPD